jgi:hypothetical protein
MRVDMTCGWICEDLSRRSASVWAGGGRQKLLKLVTVRSFRQMLTAVTYRCHIRFSVFQFWEVDMRSVLAPARESVVVFDEVVAARHRSEFARLLSDPGLRDRVDADVVGRRASLVDEPGASSTRVAVEVLVGLDGNRTLIARGEVLVSAASAEGIRLLTGSGFARVGRVGSVLRFQNLGADAAVVRATCHELLWRGVRASPNYVVVAGGIVKGCLGLLEPLPTHGRPAVSATSDRWQAAVDVAVLDTGGSTAAGHGTFVAGLVRQLAPNCRLDAQRVLASDGIGTDFSVAEALHGLADNAEAPRVVNVSLCCTPVDGLVPVAMTAALDALAVRHPQTVVVAAAGNDGSSRPSWPAAHPFVVAVGAVDGVAPAVFSNRGPWVDFSARADGVVSTNVQGMRRSGADDSSSSTSYAGPFAAWSGTSFAAAQVSGAFAAVIGNGLSRAEAIDELTRSGIPSHDCGIVLEPRSLT